MPSVTVESADAIMYASDGRPIYVDPKNPRCQAKQTVPRYDLLKDSGEPLALDIEFQEYKHKTWPKWRHRIGRIAFVNTRGQTIYDVYVRYDFDEDHEVKMPPAKYGVTHKDLRIRNGAKRIEEVEEHLHKIMAGRTIIGHGMRLDIGAIDQSIWKNMNTIDTQHMYGQVALWKLSDEFLGESIQDSAHDPSEDARATMLLYLRRYPYKERNDFKDAPFVFKDDEFPSLGGPVKKGR